MATGLPDPAVVVLVGASGAGKSTWAASRYRSAEIVSSDDLRGVVGSGRHDLDASVDAFALLDTIVAARVRRGLHTVIDTLGLDPVRRRSYLALARAGGLPAVAVVVTAPEADVRRRNAARDRPVPAPALRRQLAAMRDAPEALADEGWDLIVTVDTRAPGAEERPAPRPEPMLSPPRFVLQLSRFDWADDPAAWLRATGAAAAEAGFDGLAVMDHLIQIPQVGRAWDPIPEPWVTLGLLAGLDTRLRLGTLVSPVTFRAPGITAKAAATLDALTGGRAFLGLGAGWWQREHAAFGLPFPPPAERVDALAAAIETVRALCAPGTKAYRSEQVDLPETTCYPRPAGSLPILVGGSGRRVLELAATAADGCNVRSDDAAVARAADIVRTRCEAVGRDPAEVAITVLDTPVIGPDRDTVWQRVEAARGRTSAPAFAAAHHAGTFDEQRRRFDALRAAGVSTVFLAPQHRLGPEDVLALAPMLR